VVRGQIRPIAPGAARVILIDPRQRLVRVAVWRRPLVEQSRPLVTRS